MKVLISKYIGNFILIIMIINLVSCGGGSDGEDDNNANIAGNNAQFTFDCDLNGLNGVLTIDVEVVSSNGLVFGPGPNPDITGVINTGDVTYYTAGRLVSPTASYFFTGENNFADFTEAETFNRFRVEWLTTNEGITMVVNPFGPGPTSHDCILTEAKYT